MGGRWWFRVVVNPGENAAEGRCVDLELVNVHCFFLGFWVNPPKEKFCFFHQEIHTFIFELDFCCLGEIELTRDDVPNV